MTFGIDIELAVGDESLYVSAENIAANTRLGVERALWRSGKDIYREFNKQVKSKNKHGRLYILRGPSGRRRKHRASAPGETPANRTGTYRKGFDFNVAGFDNLIIGNTAPYAGFLEKGTRRMQARPGLRNSIRASERDILRNLSGGVEGEL